MWSMSVNVDEFDLCVSPIVHCYSTPQANLTNVDHVEPISRQVALGFQHLPRPLHTRLLLPELARDIPLRVDLHLNHAEAEFAVFVDNLGGAATSRLHACHAQG